MKAALTSVISRFAQVHRAILVLSTSGIAIAGSTVAAERDNVSAWVLVAAFGLLLLVTDLLRAVEDRATQLAETTGKPLSVTRVDVLGVSKPWRIIVIVALVALLIAGVTLTQVL